MALKVLSNVKIGGFLSSNFKDVRGMQEGFVRLIKFFDNCSSIGVSRIASNYGLAVSPYASSSPSINLNALGFGYWNDQINAGPNAWAVYKFNNATVPFYVLIQWGVAATDSNSGNAFGFAPGNPGTVPGQAFTGDGGIGIQVAMRSDGGNPWNGTTNNNGADTKGSTVWTAPTIDKLFIWPRSNSPGGTQVAGTQSIPGSRAHCNSILHSSQSDIGTAILTIFTVIADENNVLINNDLRGTGNHNIFYFGKYLPISGTSPPVPYWSFSDDNQPNFLQGLQTIGTLTAVTGSTSLRDGGIAISNPTVSGTVVGFCYDVPDPGMWGSTANFSADSANQIVTGSSVPSGSVFLERSLVLYANEQTTNGSTIFGLVGYSSDFLRCINSRHSYQTLSGGFRVALGSGGGFGGSPGTGGNTSAGKWTAPWVPGMVPFGMHNDRNGTEF